MTKILDAIKWLLKLPLFLVTSFFIWVVLKMGLFEFDK